ncbi:amino acid adenylation domain-containing protein [Sporosarcina sp. FSL W8-0480]|uniref:non-ribosomal peptide synthetase n=1 Tax=Sporosarcina sp. FSL W8-0480 TaxID=2954701 RepID=UPI0030DAB9D6
MTNKKNIQSIYQLSPLQEGILFEKLRDPENSSYFIQNAFTLKGKVNETYIRQAISLLSIKYDTLRTAIVIAKSTGKPWQVVLKDREIEIQKEVIKDQPLDKRTELIKSIKAADIERDFNLESDSLLRVTLIEASSDEWIILWSAHHILIDGWCNSIIIGDFFRLYELLEEGLHYNDLKEKVAVEKAEVGSYGDFIKWLQAQDHNQAEEYWRNLLVDYDTVAGIIPLEDKPAPSEGNCVIHSMTLESSEKVKEFAKSHRMTLNRIVETAWGILLQKYNNSNDVVFGKVVSGRDGRVKNIERAIGLFINTIPVRIRCERDTTVLDLLKDMDNQAIASQAYEYFALSEIQKQSPIQGQLFDTLFVFENYYVSNSELDTSFDFEIVGESGREETNYDICIGVDAQDRIVFDILYDTKKFSEYEIKLILERLDHLILEMINNPGKAIGHLNLIDENEQEMVVKQFNQSESLDELYSSETIIEHFERQVVKTPDNIALVYEDEELTYDELNRKANSLSHKLRELGVGRNDIVAILSERNLEMMIGIYGVMKSGGAYGPIDISFPKDRINFILNDYSPKVILLGKGVDAPEGDYVCLHLFSEDAYSGCEENPVKINEKEDLIYLTSTSGTSGKPKSVMVEHAGATSYVRSFADEFNISEETVALQHTAYNFDTIVEEVYPVHIRGGKVVLYNEERITDINKACDYMDEHEVTLISCSTLLLKEFNQGRIPKTVNLYLNGGDTLKYSYIDNLLEHANVGNTFGSTEQTVCAAFYHVPKDQTGTIQAGKPIVGRTAYICQDEQICGIGIPGELCITGSGVSRGYLNSEELTKEKFVDNPFGEGKMYRSGDLVRWLPDGNIEYLGRIDNQVKIRGYRVELQEIEEVFNKQAGIKETVVIAKEIDEGNQALCAYVVMDEENATDIVTVKAGVRKELPEYMIPAYVMEIAEIPLTVNGKIDKKALPAIELERHVEYIAPRNSVEETLCKLFEEVLGIDQVGIKDNFFELGGDSIKAIRFTTLCRNVDYALSIKKLMKNGTVLELAKALMDEGQEDGHEKVDYSSELDINKKIADAKIHYKDFLEELDSYGDSIVRGNSVGEYEPSLSQQIFLEDTIGGGSSGRFILEGEYTVSELERAILRVIAEQSVLRTRYDQEKNLFIESEISTNHRIPVVDISGSNQKDTQVVYSLVEKFGLDTKNLFEGPLLNKICIIKATHNKYVVYIFIHHALWDMTSSSIFERRINQLLKEPELIHRKIEDHFYSQHVKNETAVKGSSELKFNEFVNAAQNMDLLYKNKSKMTVFKKKFDESNVDHTVMTNQLLATLSLLEAIILQEETMKAVDKIPVIILHHGRNASNSRTLGLFQEAKLFTIDLAERNRFEKISELLANSPELCLGIRDLNREQENWLIENGSKIPSVNAVTSYGDDSGITAESTLDMNARKIIDTSSGKLPINVRCQFTDDGVVIVATGFENREEQVMEAMDKIILHGYRMVEV